jgi:hypothetical protein
LPHCLSVAALQPLPNIDKWSVFRDLRGFLAGRTGYGEQELARNRTRTGVSVDIALLYCKHLPVLAKSRRRVYAETNSI